MSLTHAELLKMAKQWIGSMTSAELEKKIKKEMELDYPNLKKSVS